ncbi:MAG: UvrD-helicase domain-containing protein [Spirochaetota bacterium]
MSQTKVTMGMGPSFLDSFSRLPRSQQGKVRQFMADFRRNPKSAAIHMESIDEFRDQKLRSVRIDQAYRGIVLDAGDGKTYVLLWVDHHDEAYRWARNKVFEVNESTGLIQYYDQETVIERAESTTADTAAESAEGQQLFSEVRDRELKRLGIPEVQIPYVKQIQDEDDLNAKLDRFSRDVADRLQLLAAGFSLEEVEREFAVSGSEKPDGPDDYAGALRHSAEQGLFALLTEDKLLQDMLDYPLEKWRVFLHPSQKNLVQMHSNGPFRVLGGAGTGKTVVAMHRARFLAQEMLRKNGKGRILFTTFSRNLAKNIEKNLSKICTPAELERIEVLNLDAWARRFMEQRGYKSDIVSAAKQKELWETALAHDELGLSAQFYRWEWEHLIQPEGIHNVREYLQISRRGMGTALTRRQRQKAWAVFQNYRTLLDSHELVEFDDIIRTAMELIRSHSAQLPYGHVIVDEAQDFSKSRYLLIRQILLAGRLEQDLGPDSLFIVGDSQQRIYRRRISLSQCGIPIRGRSRILRLNYRTTQEIGRFAAGILQGMSYDDLEDGELDTRGYHSVLHGEEPLLKGFASYQEEIDFLARQLQSDSRGVCLLTRTNAQLQRYKNALEGRGIVLHTISLDDSDYPEELAITTMHKVKGLEFEQVFLVGMNSDTMPYKAVLDRLTDEAQREDFIRRERSLLYVALTRARRAAVISWYGEKSDWL